MHTKKEQGFTLFELIVTLAVAAIILSFGVPGFMSFIDNSRATTHANDLVTALNLARNEAIRRGATVSVCSSTDGATCDGDSNWSTGWIVISGGDVLRVWPERSGGANVVTGNVEQIDFEARGALGGAVDPQIDVTLPDCTGHNGREVTVNAPGRISVSRVVC